MSIEQHLREVRERIAQAAIQAGREPSSVRLVAVTKTFPVEKILAAFAAGARDIGENRVEEAGDKIPVLERQISPSDPITWHLIGHLQRRKVRAAVELFDMIQSLDTVKLAETLDRQARAARKRMPVLLQVNVAADPNKFGFAAEPRNELYQAIEKILPLDSIEVRGLMTIGPLVTNPEDARPYFRGLRELRDELASRYPQAAWRELSMGMTDDYAVAIAEGATIVRIGRAIFGERRPPEGE